MKKRREQELLVNNNIPDLATYCQQSLSFVLHDWQLKLCSILERCKTERGLRILLHAPPQYGKSVIVSQRLPAWLITNDPLHRVGLACYNETHATGFGDVVKSLLADSTNPDVRVSKRVSSKAFSTPARERLRDAQYSFLSMGLMTGFVGKGVDTLFIDDPYKSPEDAHSRVINAKTIRFWTWTTLPRIKDANVVIMFHRYHDRDLAGYLIKEGGWEYYRFSAICDEEDGDVMGRNKGDLLSPIYSRERLELLRKADPFTFAGQFQGNPRPENGIIFPKYDDEGDEIYQECEPPNDTVWVIYTDPNLSKKGKGDTAAIVKLGYSLSTKSFYVKARCRSYSRGYDLLDDVLALYDAKNTFGVAFDGHVSQESTWSDIVNNYCSQTGLLYPYIEYKRYDIDVLAKNLQLAWLSKNIFFEIGFTDTVEGQNFLDQFYGFSGKKANKLDDAPDALISAFNFIYERRLVVRESSTSEIFFYKENDNSW